MFSKFKNYASGSRGSKGSRNSNSELIRCATQIRAMGFAIMLIVIAMIIVSTIKESELKKLTTSALSGNMPSGLLQETNRKLMASAILAFIGTVIFVLAILMATRKSCYKTSLFGIIFGLLFGIL